MLTALPYRRARTTNSTATGFQTLAATNTKPSGEGVIPLARGNDLSLNDMLLIIPFGTGAADNVMNVRVIGWRRITTGVGPGKTLWIPSIICEIIATLSTFAGVSGGPISDTELIADTITITTEGTVTADVTRSGTLVVTSPANNTPAMLEVETKGFELVEIDFDDSTGNPTGMNALVAQY